MNLNVTSSRHKLRSMLAAILLLALLAAACGGADDDPGTSGGEADADDTAEQAADDAADDDAAADDADADADAADPGAADEGEPVSGGSLTMALNTEQPVGLDPALCQQGFARCYPVFGTLMVYDADSRTAHPGMAESLESDDGINWTLTLRPDVTFTDGTPFDAEAVVYNWDRIRDPETLAPGRALAETMEWEVVDDLTVAITLDEPNYELPIVMIDAMGFIGSPTALEEKGEDFGNDPVGAGPFMLDEWVRSSHATFVRNPDYWDAPKPYLDEFTIQVIPADDQRMNALRTGEIDLMWTLLTEYHALAEEEGFVVDTQPLVGGTGVQFNMRDGSPLQHDDLRLAIQHAMDVQQINDALYPGDPGPETLISEEFFPAYADAEAAYPEQDLEAAQERFDAYLADTGQDSVTIQHITWAGVPILIQASELFKAQVERIEGLTVEIVPTEGAQVSADMSAGNYETVLTGNIVTHPALLHDYLVTDGSLNRTGYANPDLDEAFQLARSSADQETRDEAYATVNRLASQDGPIRIWRYQITGFAHAPEIHGVSIYNISMLPETLWVEQ